MCYYDIVMDNFEAPKSKENIYSSLKQGLLSGARSLEQVRNELVDMDQRTSLHEAAILNLEFLRDIEVVEFVFSHPESREGYERLLSLTEFHVAQRQAIEGNPGAVGHFQAALEASLSVTGNGAWTAYVKGTILYMQGGTIPENIIAEVVDEKNVQVLKNLNDGLQHRGHPSYKEDYRK